MDLLPHLRQAHDHIDRHYARPLGLDELARVAGVSKYHFARSFEAALAPFGARPHWGKVFSTPPDVVRGLYPRYDDFVDLLQRYDPAGKFRNEFTDRYFPRS